LGKKGVVELVLPEIVTNNQVVFVQIRDFFEDKDAFNPTGSGSLLESMFSATPVDAAMLHRDPE